METYQLFKSASGDIMNAKGSSYYDDYDIANANGDIMNASGVGACDPSLPYPPDRIQMLRDVVSKTKTDYAAAKAAEDQAYRDMRNCETRVFCIASSRRRVYSGKQASTKVAIQFRNAAVADLAQAEKANKDADIEYDQCYDREQERIASEAKEAAEAAKLAAKSESELAEIDVERKKVSVAQMEGAKDYAVYGLIAVGIVAVSLFGYKLVTK